MMEKILIPNDEYRIWANFVAEKIKYKSYSAEHCENEEMIRDMIIWFKKVL